MQMSPGNASLDLLNRVADEVQQTFSERHHKITAAIESDRAFQVDRRPLSALVRALVLKAVSVGASQVGMDAQTIAGGGVELLVFEGIYLHHFRVRTATRDEDGNLQIIVNGDPAEDFSSGSINDQGTFVVDEHWVFAYIYDDEGFIQELLAAKVLGVTDTKVRKLRLCPAIALGTPAGSSPPPGGFRPADEDDLAGLEDDVEDDESGSAGA